MSGVLPIDLSSLICARLGCGMQMYLHRSANNHRGVFVHPYSQSPRHCIDEGRVYRENRTFAGWWADREWMKTRGMI